MDFPCPKNKKFCKVDEFTKYYKKTELDELKQMKWDADLVMITDSMREEAALE